METKRTTAATRSRLKLLSSRIALLLVGLGAGLLATEVLLQVGALYVGTTTGKAAVAFRTQRLRILALGDSNTYGFYVGPTNAYPHLLQTLWNEQRPENRSLEVLNLGFPGTNSSQILRDFDRMLLAFRPDVVTLMIGANDPWTVPVRLEEERAPIELREFLWKYSRLFRLLYMLLRAYENATLEVLMDPDWNLFSGTGHARYGSFTFSLGHQAASGQTAPDWTVRLERNLTAVIQKAREARVTPLLLTYPSNQHLYGYANAILRGVASETGATLIDVAAQFPPECSKGQCEDFFPDQHPTKRGHERVAAILGEELERLLLESTTP